MNAAEEATVETWTPTMELRQHHTAGAPIPGTGGTAHLRVTVLEQKWVSSGGNVAWRAVPEFSDNPNTPMRSATEEASELLGILAKRLPDPTFQ
jgi:hypothetical protein